MSAVIAAKAKLQPDAADSELRSLRKKYPSLIIQLVTLKRLPPGGAITMIGHQTLRASKTRAMLAAKPEVDLLLRLAGTTQIAVAIKEAGYRGRGKKLLVAVGSPKGVGRLRERLAGDPNYEILEDNEPDKGGLAMVETAALLGTRS